MKKLEDMTEPELAKTMRAFADAIQWTADFIGVEKIHFALVVFNDPKVGQYIGNCCRQDIVAALRETADRLAKREDIPR